VFSLFVDHRCAVASVTVAHHYAVVRVFRVSVAYRYAVSGVF